MNYLRAFRDLLRAPFSTANREALGFVLMIYGGGAAVLLAIGVGIWWAFF